MTMIDHGVQGAHRATWRQNDPRPVLEIIVEQNPSGPESRWRQLFREQTRDNPDYVDAMVDYYLDNAILSILRKKLAPEKQAVPQEEVVAAKTTAKKKLREHIEREAQIILFDLIMPNGKRLPDCTGAECRTFGVLFSKIAEKVPEKKKVGQVLSEGEARKLYLAATEK